MFEPLPEPLKRIVDELQSLAQNKWWVVLVWLVYRLLEHRILEKINHYIDSGRGTAFKYVQTIRALLSGGGMNISTYFAIVLVSWAAIATAQPHSPPYVNGLVSVAVGLIVVLVTSTFRRQSRRLKTPKTAQGATDTPSRLKLGVIGSVSIGAGWGLTGHILQIVNTESSYDYPIHGIRAELTYTHLHSGEVIRKTAHFVQIDKEKVLRRPVTTLSLRLSQQQSAWLVFLVHDTSDDIIRTFANPAPVNDKPPLPVTDWVFDPMSEVSLGLGQWLMRVEVKSDSVRDYISTDIKFQIKQGGAVEMFDLPKTLGPLFDR